MSDNDADATSVTAPVPKTLADLNFHRSFRKKEAGDVILQADDRQELCFYFRHSRLTELSSFFANLPSPSEQDMVEGVTLIPLHDTTSPALLISLLALQSLTKATPLELDATYYTINLQLNHFTDAAVFARKYDLPVVYRLAMAGSQTIKGLTSKRNEVFLDFAVWAIAGVWSATGRAAQATLKHDITKAPREILIALQKHAPQDLFKLQELHLRRALGVSRFNSEPLLQKISDECADCERCNDVSSDMRNLFRRARSVEELLQVEDGDYEQECSECEGMVRRAYAPKLQWFKAFTSEYGYPASYEEYHTKATRQGLYE